MTSSMYNSVGGSFGAIASAFVVESLEHMIGWLIALTAVVFCDLIAGISRLLKQKQKVRFSKACRDTLAKFTTYFAVVVCFAFIEVAAQTDTPIEKYACMFVIFVESCSIASNILKYHGYQLDMNRLFSIILKKKFDVETEDGNGIIVKDKGNENE